MFVLSFFILRIMPLAIMPILSFFALSCGSCNQHESYFFILSVDENRFYGL